MGSDGSVGGGGCGPVSDTTEELDRWEPAGHEDKRTRPAGEMR